MPADKNTARIGGGLLPVAGRGMARLPGNGMLPAIGGLCAFVVVMGIGRFVYTVLLPGMMDAYGFGADVAGMMAAWNYAGYLAGVLAMRGEKPGLRRYVLFVAFLAVSLASTAGMGLARTPVPWHALRFTAGFASGACFVLCSSIVLDTLAACNRPVLAGLLYSGVGTGIALGGIAAGPLESAGGPAAAWPGMAALCLLPALAACVALRPGVNRIPAGPAPAPDARPDPGQGRRYAILLLAYFLEGFGYIIGATFLVALVKSATNSPEIARASWIVTGVAAALSTPAWRYAARGGYLRMLVSAFLLQGAGALLPVLSSAPAAALASGLLLGGTFMGITMLSLQYGVALSGRPSAHTVAVMTALYGAGQIIGPFVAGFTARGQDFFLAFVLSGASLFVAAGLLLAGGSGEKS